MDANKALQALERATGRNLHDAGADPDQAHIEATCINDVQPEAITWLWPGRFPLGKLSIISGDPGLGKSLVTLAITAAVSRGEAWPCREGAAPAGDVVLISAEDDPADTIRPRLEAAGADLTRVHVVQAVRIPTDDGSIVRKPWDFNDLVALGELLDRLPECRLVIVDPVSAYLAGTDSHKNADVRALLTPLAELAASHKVAILAVSHLNKSAGPAMYRTSGSLAFVAAARAAYAVAKDKDDPDRRLVLPIKCNLSPDSTGLAYRIGTAESGAPIIEWETDPVTITADEALAVLREDDGERSQADEATDWLRDALAAGPERAKDVQRRAHADGIGDKALRRARERLGVRSEQLGFHGGWVLALPGHTDAQNHTDAHHKDTGACGNEGACASEDAQSAEDAPSKYMGTFRDEGHLQVPRADNGTANLPIPSATDTSEVTYGDL